MYSQYYKDAGCPSQCMTNNDYAPLMGEVSCPTECKTNYAVPGVTTNCPSACTYFEDYNTLSTVYDMYIPSSTKSRLIPTPSVISDYQVENPRISNFAGQVQPTTAFETGVSTAQLMNKLDALQKQVAELNNVAKMAEASKNNAVQSAQQSARALNNEGPATAAVQANAANASAQQANSAAQQASALAADIKNTVAQISADASKVPSTPAVTQALQAAQDAASQAGAQVAAAQQAAATASSAASQTSTAVASTKEGFRYLRYGKW